MQIVGPVFPAARQDAGAPAVAPAAPTAPVSPAAGVGASGQTRRDTGERGQPPARPAFPAPDPERPAGPRPAFDTTPLELEQERRQGSASLFWRGETATEARGPAPRRLDKDV